MGGATTRDGAAEEPLSAQARQAIYEREEAKLGARFGEESVDSDWSIRAEENIRTAIDRLRRASKFRIGGIECKETVCEVSLEWAARRDATSEYSKFLESRYGMKCATFMYLPESADASVSYKATLFLDCERADAGG